jgi:hypothetical protein
MTNGFILYGQKLFQTTAKYTYIFHSKVTNTLSVNFLGGLLPHVGHLSIKLVVVGPEKRRQCNNASGSNYTFKILQNIYNFQASL